MNIAQEWRKSRMNSDMTVQTVVALQNIWPVSDLGLEVAKSELKTSDSMLFVKKRSVTFEQKIKIWATVWT